MPIKPRTRQSIPIFLSTSRYLAHTRHHNKIGVGMATPPMRRNLVVGEPYNNASVHITIVGIKTIWIHIFLALLVITFTYVSSMWKRPY